MDTSYSNNSTKEAVAKSVVHTLEVAVAGSIGLFVLYMFKDDADIMAAIKDALLAIIPVAIAAFVPKFARSHGGIPVGDYVNEK